MAMSAHVRRLDFSDVALYGVTPAAKDPALLLEKLEQALAGGIDAVQLRLKGVPDREFAGLAKEFKKRCDAAGTLFIINDRPDIAHFVDASGVHLGHEDLPISFARELLGHRRIIGASTHSLPQALEAQRQGADYVSCGPVWATPTKPDYPAVSLQLIGLYRAALKIPFVAIGGIDENNIGQVVKAGAERVAVVRALFDSANPLLAARVLREKVTGQNLATA